MRLRPTFTLLVLTLVVLSACAPVTSSQEVFKPGFFHLSFDPEPSLVISDAPGMESRQRISLTPPLDCSLFALHPAPKGPWIAVEWECSFGPAVELFNTSTGKSRFALANPSIDSRFLSWRPDGLSLYLKIGTLSVPQTLRVDASSGQATELPISPFAYDLISSPDGKRILYSLTKGIGFGSETWLAGPDGNNPSQLMLDAGNITALAQYSPDGSQFAYIKFPDNQAGTPPGELWLADADGFTPRRLAIADAGRGFAPAWSPDGNKISFIGRDRPEDPDSINLSIYDLPSDQLQTVAIKPGSAPVWSPDGSLIIFNSADPISAAGDTIIVISYEVASGQIDQLINRACCAGWMR